MFVNNENNQLHNSAPSRRSFIAMTGIAVTAACAPTTGGKYGAPKQQYNDREGFVMTPNVKHVVFMKFKAGVTEKRIAEHKDAVIGLNGQIPVLRNIEFGADFADRADGLTHCIIVTLGRRSDVEEYLNHPVHVPVAKALVADLERILVMDVEFGV